MSKEGKKRVLLCPLSLLEDAVGPGCKDHIILLRDLHEFFYSQSKHIDSVIDSIKKLYELKDMDYISKVSEVLIWGCTEKPRKYKPNDWKNYPVSVYFESALRHYIKVCKGIEKDEESPFSHLDHFICNVALMKEQLDSKDDRGDWS